MRNLTIGVLCKSQVHGKFALCLIRAMDELKEFAVDLKLLIGFSNLPVARSKVLTQWYEERGPGDWFFFLDADQTFRTEDLRSILALPGDMRCGLYANALGECIGEPVDKQAFFEGRNLEILSAGCGLMAVSWEIVDRLAKTLPRVQVRPGELVLPFFQTIYVKQDAVLHWLGEDTSFCTKIREIGGKIYGFVSPTIGHEVYKVETL